MSESSTNAVLGISLARLFRPYRLCLFLAISVLAGCTTVPRGAAVQTEILQAAADPAADFAVYPVTRAFLDTLSRWPGGDGARLSWIGASQGATDQIIRPGDSLGLRIWDRGDNSLLTAPEERAVDLPDVRVSPGGSVFVPYLGDVTVAGQSVDAARAEIQTAVEAIVPSAQVQLTLSEGRGNSADLVGGVANPGSYPLPDRNYTVMNLIAAGGGVATGLRNPQVRLVRAQKVYGISVDRLFAMPALDTRLTGGDKVFVEEDDRFFLSLGAAGREAEHPFSRDHLTAIEALAIMGGVNDARADPGGVLVLRDYPASAVRAAGPSQRQVVFTLDLTTADGLFAAREFPIHHGDLVMATESPVTNLRTVLGVIGSAFGVVNAVED